MSTYAIDGNVMEQATPLAHPHGQEIQRYGQIVKLPIALGVFRVIGVALMMLVASSAFAQDRDRAAFVPDVVTRAILDPTTYAPAIVAWAATDLDWRSSQIFFENGFFEHNARFTISGLSDDTPIGYAAGNRRIFTDAIANLRLSAVNNVADQVIERLLLRRHPTHRTLIRTIGWIERSVMASYLSHRLSARHFRQWRENHRRARELGYK